MAKYQHIIWDWNGTLLDDAWLCVEILNDITRKYNKPSITFEQYRSEFDFPVKDYYRRIGFDFTIESFETVANDYITEYNRRRFECNLNSDAANVLHLSSKAGLTQSILSAYQQTRLEEAVAHFKITDFFTKLFGLNDYYAAGKIENGKRLIEQLDCGANQVLLIGDTTHDYEVAQSIGADCVLLACGHQSKEKLLSCKTTILDNLIQISDIINH
ncbi:HAD family hydrolase [Planctomycetota bacterium]